MRLIIMLPTISSCLTLQTGVKVTNVGDLQDIDELCVVEVGLTGAATVW
jgi:hypothetical protein